MNMRRHLPAALLALSLSTSLACADNVLLKSGDVLSGTIKQVSPETVDLDTPYAGLIHIKRDSVKTLRSDKTVTITAADGASHAAFVAPVADNSSWHEVDAPAPAVAVAAAPAPIPAPAPAPAKTFALDLERYYLPLGPHWKNQFSLGVVNTAGNTDSTNLAAEVDLNYKDSPHELNLKLGGVYDITQGVETAGQFYLDALYRRSFPQWDPAERFYLFAENHELYDHVKEISYRITNSVGAGYYFFKGERFTLDLRAGPAYVCEKLFSGDSSSDTSGLAGLRAEYKFNERITLTQDTVYTNALTYLDRYQLTSDTALNIKVPELFRGAGLKFDFRDDYDNNAPAGHKNNDTRLTLAVTMDF